ncbi:FadR family transcriptional regulator [Aestuariicella hydrocarbonica]|uniref:FadR family transcriptional regulator n=1 Tax=Pseudomaricurvus hydrocarbonicus TaxID=1470433 RepID=A0A9E5MNF4_9GAMM|nr:FadR family transcriptional regulator [Aestuariicella hydrocarbonica]
MKEKKPQKRHLVQNTAEKLREFILDEEPGNYLGSLNEVAEKLDVGIVTVQQAARVLEHEGLLTVKRGPGGGYYGARPDDAALLRSFATYMRLHNISYRDAFELSVLLDCEIIKSVAESYDASHVEHITQLQDQLQQCANANDVIAFEQNFRETLLQISSRPLLELLSRVAMQMYIAKDDQEQFTRLFGIEEWRQGRQRILQAIMAHDAELASFEAQRFQALAQKWMSDDRNTAAKAPRDS